MEKKLNKIDIHADDYALSNNSDNDILELLEQGSLTSISIIPNLEIFNTASQKFLQLKHKLNKNINVSVHLNFMEGKSCAAKNLLPHLTDKNGFFNISWGKLFIFNYIPFLRKIIKKELTIEITAQINKCLAAGVVSKESLRIDSHQHPHMIPLVFTSLLQSLKELKNDGVKIEYIRNTCDPILLYGLKNIFSMNTIKCLILNFYSKKVSRYLKKNGLYDSYLCGVYYSGKMNERIEKVLPSFIKKAQNKSRTLELLFHPGTMLKSELTNEFTKEGFNDFHLSINRHIEYEQVKKLSTQN